MQTHGFKVFLSNRLGLDHKGIRYGLLLALSAWLAFTIATLLGVHNAFWAAMPIFVVAQATRGLTLERGIYRVLGTLIGALAGFAILQFIHYPYLALGLLAIWVGIFAGLTHLLYGVHSYAALLSGITAAVVIIFRPPTSTYCHFPVLLFWQMPFFSAFCSFLSIFPWDEYPAAV